MKHTPLIEQHRVDGAKLVDFAGWEMPIQYASVIDEYQAVRSAAGLFDVSHMGRITVSGQRSLAFLQRMTTNNVSALAPGQAHYSMVCNENGGIKDDIFVYRTGDTEYLLCVNASNREKILAWLLEHRTADDRCQIEDRTAALAQIAIQGPFVTRHPRRRRSRRDRRTENAPLPRHPSRRRELLRGQNGLLWGAGLRTECAGRPSGRSLEMLVAGRSRKGPQTSGARRPGSTTSGNGVFVVRERHRRRDDAD